MCSLFLFLSPYVNSMQFPVRLIVCLDSYLVYRILSTMKYQNMGFSPCTSNWFHMRWFSKIHSGLRYKDGGKYQICPKWRKSHTSRKHNWCILQLLKRLGSGFFRPLVYINRVPYAYRKITNRLILLHTKLNINLWAVSYLLNVKLTGCWSYAHLCDLS